MSEKVVPLPTRARSSVPRPDKGADGSAMETGSGVCGGDARRCPVKEARWVAVVLLVLLGQLAVFNGTAGAQSDACHVGRELSPGDYCTVDIPNISVGTNRFEVRSDGRGCYGGICSRNAMNLNGFEASRIAGTSRWRIDALPGGGTTNQPPRVTGAVPAQTLTVGGGSASVNVARYFTDPDGDRLTYTARSSGTGVVRASVSGSVVTLSPVSAGTATVTVTASDPDGASATQAIAVTVRSSSTDTSDRATLEAFYGATGGANWTNNTNWRTSAPLDEWYGVTTDAAGRVTRLELSYNGLTGSIPPALGNLVNLETLVLQDNALTGSIPSALGSLTNLATLNLGYNELSGAIPVELGHLANLETLSVLLNELAGPIPRELGRLAKLETLRLGGNALTGAIPAELGNLADLRRLDLGYNDLTGAVPTWLGRLTHLQTLDLEANDLIETIPRELGSLAELEVLILGANRLTGQVPAWLGNLVQLRELALDTNGLTGSIPVELGRLTNLRRLSLGWNDLTGPIPTWLGRLADLRRLSLAWNDFTGSIPVELGALANLEHLDLYGNDLTGPIPVELGGLTNLRYVRVAGNGLTGAIPVELGSLANLEWLDLRANALTGSIPVELVGLAKLERLDLSYNWGLSGPLPAGLEQSRIEALDVFVTRTCAPAGWREWLATIEFYGRPCEVDADVMIDVAVVYTPAARESAGGTAAIEAEIDLMVAETNEVYATSGVRQRLALVGRAEVPYIETYGRQDLRRLQDASDGHLDEVHALRDATGADVVHLIASERYGVCGIAGLASAFGITAVDCGGVTFAHELGHNMGLRHDRFQVQLIEAPLHEERLASHPAYGYVNQRLFDPVAPQSSHWTTIMSYRRHCRLADVTCSVLPRFSNPRQRYGGDPLGVPFGTGSGVSGPSDAVAVLEAMGPAVAAWRDRPDTAANRPPVPAGTLPNRRLESVGATLDVDVSLAFVDPDGDALNYTASSTAPWVSRADAAGAAVTLTAVSEGTATIGVTATDPGGLSVSRLFSATVEGRADADPQDSVESDRAVLEALYDATGGPDWTDGRNWKTSAPLGEWHGVTTDADGRVTELDLHGNGLAGFVAPALGNLGNLESLSLGWNDLTGPIPASLGNLARLRRLDLSGRGDTTGLTGPIPAELARLANLEWLSLGGNGLTGPIPAELGRLRSLQRLDLTGNDLVGSIPASFGNLARLRSVLLGWNQLTGEIPGALGALTSLERLSLEGNKLTGPIPTQLGNLADLETLQLGGNDLTGRIPRELGSLASLRTLDLSLNDLSGPVPSSLGNLANLERLDLSYAWGLSGPLPAGLEQSALGELDVLVTGTCAPAAWREWLATIEFLGPLCGSDRDVTIDVAVAYTPAAREAAGGTAAIEAEIDLMIAETNEAYAASGVHQRVALTGRSEVPYAETFGLRDVYQLADPEDGELDEVHALLDRTGADLAHLIVGRPYDLCGIAFLPMLGWPGAFGITLRDCGGIVFAHELGHNMGLRHDRFQVQVNQGGVFSHPGYGYVNQRMFESGAPPSSRWTTIMAYEVHCGLADARCAPLLRFSNPLHRHNGDPLGVAHGAGSGVTGAADAAAVLNATGPAAAAWRDRPPRANRAPVAVGTLPDRRLRLDGRLTVDVSQAFDDPDGDELTYGASSSSANVVTVRAAGGRVTLTAVGRGTAAIQVTATDPGGLSAAQSFRVTVAAAPAPFTDDPIRPGVTPIRAVHFTELRTRIDALRVAAGLGRFRWTDPVLRAGVTRVRLAHLLELRDALSAAYAAAGRPPPRWSDTAAAGGATAIRAAHVTELRAAVMALE